MKLAFLAASACTFALIACSSDSTSSNSTTTTTTASSTSGGDGGQGGTATTTTTGGGNMAGGGGDMTGGGGKPTGAGGGGGAPPAMGACINQADGAILQAPNNTVQADVEKCGKDNLGQEPATKNCIKMKTNLSDGCVTCFDDLVQCVAKNCFNDCFADPNGQPCLDCRAAKCDPAFEKCSGLPTN